MSDQDITQKEKKVKTFSNGHISENRYDSLIVNSDNVWIADVDISKELSKYASNIQSNNQLDKFVEEMRFYNEHPRELAKEKISILLDQITRSILTNVENGVYSCYETPKGLRLIRLDKKIAPNSEESKQLMSQVYADELYKKLTQKQDCYRARVTPKPWRDVKDEKISAAKWIGDFRKTDDTVRILCDLFVSNDKDISYVKSLHDRLAGVFDEVNYLG